MLRYGTPEASCRVKVLADVAKRALDFALRLGPILSAGFGVEAEMTRQIDQAAIVDPETILRRFTRSNVQHPTYRPLAELGKAQRPCSCAVTCIRRRSGGKSTKG